MMAYRLTLVGVGLIILAYVYSKYSYRCCIQTKLDTAYDYIIVGGGTAGCVLASRLSEDLSITILLLEAGDEETKVPKVDIPLSSWELQKTNVDWAFETTSQKHACKSMNSQRSFWPRGKVLGGTSSISNLVYLRGSRYDFDAWAAGGCDGWGYEDVLPYFIKAENNQNKEYVKSGYHGSEGPMVVSDIRSTSFPEAFIQAGRELGYKSSDLNGEEQQGFMHMQSMTNRGRRWSSAKAYLRPAMGRKNLHVAVLSQVTKIVFKDKRAVGVQFVRNETKQEVTARKEVILSAGTVGSAHLLLLSGIGPEQQLTKMQVPVVANLSVGENLQDHVTIDGPEFFLKEPIAITEEKVQSFWVTLDYNLFGTSYLSSTGGLDGTAFFGSKYQSDNPKVPQLQMHLVNFLLGHSDNSTKHFKHIFNIKEEVFNELHGLCNKRDGFLLLPILLHPKSRGTIRLKSPNPNDPPVIDPAYLQHPDDVKKLIEGVRLAQQIASTQIFKTFLQTSSTKKVHPGCVQHPYNSDQYWECYVQHNTLTFYDPVGSCKMGSAGDRTSVVDPQMRVWGIEALRVVDPSILPTAPSGNTAAIAIMIGEKAADLILGINTIQKINKTQHSPVL